MWFEREAKKIEREARRRFGAPFIIGAVLLLGIITFGRAVWPTIEWAVTAIRSYWALDITRSQAIVQEQGTEEFDIHAFNPSNNVSIATTTKQKVSIENCNVVVSVDSESQSSGGMLSPVVDRNSSAMTIPLKKVLSISVDVGPMFNADAGTKIQFQTNGVHVVELKTSSADAVRVVTNNPNADGSTFHFDQQFPGAMFQFRATEGAQGFVEALATLVRHCSGKKPEILHS